MADDNVVELDSSEITPKSMISRLTRHAEDIEDMSVVIAWKNGVCASYFCDGNLRDMVYLLKVMELDIANRLNEHWKESSHPRDKPHPPGDLG